jgi:hypothetical protein
LKRHLKASFPKTTSYEDSSILLRAAIGGKSNSGGTRTTGGGATSSCQNHFHIVIDLGFDFFRNSNEIEMKLKIMKTEFQGFDMNR